MRKVTQIILACFIGVSCTYSTEMEKEIKPEEKSTWRLSVGGIRRKSSLELTTNGLGDSSNSVYINGDVEATTPGSWHYNVDNALEQAAILTEVTYSTLTEASIDDENGNGISIKLMNELMNKDSFAIDFVLGLNFIHFDIDQSNIATLTNHTYDITSSPWTDSDAPTVPDVKDHHLGTTPPAVVGLGIPTNGWTAISHYDMEYAVVGLDLGVSFRTISDSNLNLFVSAGPTLSVVAHDMEKETILDYGTSTSVVDSRTGDGIDLVAGVYIEAGLNFKISERWAAELSVRYDEAFNKIENEVAEIDLSGGSVIVSLGYNF